MKSEIDAAQIGNDKQYRWSLEQTDAYWRKQAEVVDWIKPFRSVKDTSFDRSDFRIRWFGGGALNVSVNCLDRHLESSADKVAILWEGDDPSDVRIITYRELHRDTCRIANVLKARGVRKGDRVSLYMPMVPEAAAAMLACTRIGAIHSVVFGGFSPESLANRVQDCSAKLVITVDEGRRGGKTIPYKSNVDLALSTCRSVETVLVVRRTGTPVAMQNGRDFWLEDLTHGVDDYCAPEVMGAEDPLFILYTSGSTGKPKGVLCSPSAPMAQI